MAELNVNDITTTTIDPTDKVYGFNANESKAPTVQTLLGTAPGIMAVGTCATAAATAAKAVTSANWTAKPGQSILIEFTNANTANNVTLSINQGNAIPVYALNTSIRLGSGSIPAGPMIFTLSADGTKFYAHTVAVDTTSKVIQLGDIVLVYGLKQISYTFGTTLQVVIDNLPVTFSEAPLVFYGVRESDVLRDFNIIYSSTPNSVNFYIMAKRGSETAVGNSGLSYLLIGKKSN